MPGAGPKQAARATDRPGKDEEAPCCEDLAPAVEVVAGLVVVARPY